MEKEEKVNEVRKEGQLIGEKLKRGVLIGKRERNSTPSPTWNFGVVQPDGTLIPDLNLHFTSSNTLSARKLGANLWEMLPQSNPNPGLAKLSKFGPIFGHQKEGNISSKELQEEPAENQPATGINFGQQVAASPSQHNLRVKNVVQVQQPLSPASYCSSMEMPTYKPAISPRSSLFIRGKLGESSQGLQTSTELLKLLNRIWSLEEKHALDMSLVKMLRRELDQSQVRIQELMQEKKKDQTEINNLKKWLSEYKVARKKEKDQLKDAVKAVEHKVEDEHKLRRNSERLNHKLDKELLDLRSLLSNSLRELERERKARTLLEDLCDEFAKGIRDYEHEIRSVKHKYCKDQIRGEGSDRLILHISEAWLDQRTQMKLSNARNVSERQADLDKLCFEIEGFLQAKQSGNSRKDDCIIAKNPSESSIIQQSLESFHLNEPASAPWKVNNEDDSVEGTTKSKMGKKKAQACKDSNPSTSLLPLEEDVIDEAVNEDERSARPRTDTSYRTTHSRMPTKGETKQKSFREGKNRVADTDADLHDTTTMINPSLTSEAKNLRCEKMEGSFDPSMFVTGSRSPVKKWILDTSAKDPNISGASSRWPRSVRSGSLKAKLMEARFEGQQSRPATSTDLLSKLN